MVATISVLQRWKVIIDEILRAYCDAIARADITQLELSSEAFSMLIQENKDKLITQNELPKDSKQAMTINGKPLQVIQDDNIWFEWK